MKAPTAQAIRRALARVERGANLDVSEAACLMAAREADLDRLCTAAGRVRDAGLQAVGRAGVVTYSPKVFIPVTRLCRDHCHYCGFAASPAELHRVGESCYLEPEEILELARHGADLQCLEALFTLGDRPEDRWPQARQWLDEHGYESTLDYVRAMAVRVLEETGLLPHVNAGVLSWAELNRLKPVVVSMGLMLETTSSRLFHDRGQPHHGSPDKDPAVRLRVLQDASRLAIPFTSGLLVGIGETATERAETVFALRAIARQYGAIQELIVQNFLPKPHTPMRSAAATSLEEFRAAIAVTRIVCGPQMRIQAPPNLVDTSACAELLAAGVDDWGGISPLTADQVNPERPWPDLDELTTLTEGVGFTMRPRLAVHPQYVRAGLPWLDPRVQPHVAALCNDVGLARAEVTPTGLPWQEPDSAHDGGHHEGLLDRRSDLELGEDVWSVHGDWTALRDQLARQNSAPAATAAAGLRSDALSALSAAEKDPGGLSDDAALTLMSADGELLADVCRLADHLRRDTVGESVTFVNNRNINFTNVCYSGCRFCAFAQRRSDADARSLTLEEIGERSYQAWECGATEVCLQGGIDPQLPGSIYLDIAAAIKDRAPQLHVHAFSPMEVAHGAARTGRSVRDFLLHARDAGLDSMPGTAAEILDDEVRWILTRGKLPTSSWVEVITTAHRVGIPSSATMMYGHVDTPRHWVNHLRLLAQIQDETGGFTEFVPLPFVHTSAPIYLAGLCRPGPTRRENLAVHAMARIMLHGRIVNIQTSWVKLGVDGVRTMLRSGANDLGGTLMEEAISRTAGSRHGSSKTPAELIEIAAGIGRPARQRTTLYDPVAQAGSTGPGPTPDPETIRVS